MKKFDSPSSICTSSDWTALLKVKFPFITLKFEVLIWTLLRRMFPNLFLLSVIKSMFSCYLLESFFILYILIVVVVVGTLYFLEYFCTVAHKQDIWSWNFPRSSRRIEVLELGYCWQGTESTSLFHQGAHVIMSFLEWFLCVKQYGRQFHA